MTKRSDRFPSLGSLNERERVSRRQTRLRTIDNEQIIFEHRDVVVRPRPLPAQSEQFLPRAPSPSHPVPAAAVPLPLPPDQNVCCLLPTEEDTASNIEQEFININY